MLNYTKGNMLFYIPLSIKNAVKGFSLKCSYFVYFKNICSEVQGKRKISQDGAVQEMRAVILGLQKKKKKANHCGVFCLRPMFLSTGCVSVALLRWETALGRELRNGPYTNYMLNCPGNMEEP